MQLEKELDNWIKEGTKYITKYYLIKNYAEKRNIELYYKYEKENEGFKKRANLGTDLKTMLSKEELHNFLENANDKFHFLLAEHIEEHWEQEIFSDNPNHYDAFNVAYYSQLKEGTQELIKPSGKVIISSGKRIANQILSKDEEINIEARNNKIRMIGWCHV